MNIWTQFTQVDAAIYGGFGIILPLVISVFNRPHFPAWLKQTIQVVLAIIGGVAVYGAKNAWNFDHPANITLAVLGVLAASQASYVGLWSKGVAPKIEKHILGGKQKPAGDVAPSASSSIQEEDPTIDPAKPPVREPESQEGQ